MDIEAVRTFVAVAAAGQFQQAAAELRVTQQAVSKRIATLERSLGVTLFLRTARGARLTLDGRSFLPHARLVLAAVDRAAASVRPGERALRVDVLNRRIAPAQAVREFYRVHPGVDLELVPLPEANVHDAIAALLSGEIDATFRAVPMPASELPEQIVAHWVLDDPLQLLAGPAHPLAGRATIAPAELGGHRIWIPGIRPGTEWAAYYAQLTAAFGLHIDRIGPNFGTEALMDAMADSGELTTLVGSRDRYVWPAGHDLRRIPLTGPTPVYPHALLVRAGNPHPGLAALCQHLITTAPPAPADVWTPPWTR
ncbi:LysR family transcriptional regulator [Actinoplanes awajinensis]|uniref:LysR family transcriptional regulator n=1 Tax=Actinoplanes awajinensis subsp. mycoplanecinus TaxID=135947 RepID=A0A101JES1_9ACTN|nr:LysR family transcriptional regulator [Actinoplanes awajinensis]KUL25418.1 LysR family transcriptional regulator [Actinoplanes awajinensis subsp. mycoplanecinus]